MTKTLALVLPAIALLAYLYSKVIEAGYIVTLPL